MSLRNEIPPYVTLSPYFDEEFQNYIRAKYTPFQTFDGLDFYQYDGVVLALDTAEDLIKTSEFYDD